jgi:hypothetical protein
MFTFLCFLFWAYLFCGRFLFWAYSGLIHFAGVSYSGLVCRLFARFSFHGPLGCYAFCLLDFLRIEGTLVFLNKVFSPISKKLK